MNTKAKDLLDIMTKIMPQSFKNAKVHKVTKDISIPLEDRWEVYIKAVKSNYLVDRDPWCFIPECIEEEYTLYDTFCIDRYQVYTYSVFLDGDYYGFSDHTVNLIKEEILQNGSSSWENDW